MPVLIELMMLIAEQNDIKYTSSMERNKKEERKIVRRMKKIETNGTTSNDTASIQIAPRDYQKLEF